MRGFVGCGGVEGYVCLYLLEGRGGSYGFLVFKFCKEKRKIGLFWCIYVIW